MGVGGEVCPLLARRHQPRGLFLDVNGAWIRMHVSYEYGPDPTQNHGRPKQGCKLTDLDTRTRPSYFFKAHARTHLEAAARAQVGRVVQARCRAAAAAAG